MTYEEWPAMVRKRLRIERGTVVFEGVMKGLASSIVSVNPTSTAHPWLLDLGNGSVVEFMPEMWIVKEANYFQER